MKFLIQSLLILLTGIAISCDAIREDENCHLTITMVNNSNRDIWFGETRSSYLGMPCQVVARVIEQGEAYKNDLLRTCWEAQIDTGYDGAMVFYFFDINANELSLSDCDSVLLNDAVVERRELRVEDLQSNNWLVEFP